MELETNRSILDEIESAADEARIIEKKALNKRQKKSEIPLKFNILDDNSISIKTNIIKYINSKQRTYQDLFDYCESHCSDVVLARRLAYNTISALKENRNIRTDTLDLLCDFLKVTSVLEERSDEIHNKNKEIQSDENKTSSKRQKKSEIPLKFNILDEASDSIKTNIIKFINSKDYTYQDLFDYCESHCSDLVMARRLAYNTISALKENRNIRTDTLDLLCDFLHVDILLEERTNGKGE